MASTINATPTSNGLIQSADNSGVLELQTGGTTAVTINGSQKVGIGTTSPDANSVVTISGATPNSKLRLAGGTSQNGLTFASAGGGNQFYVYSQNGGLVIYDDTAGAERMRITSSGQVLVGTATAPLYGKFQAYAPADNNASFVADSGLNPMLIWNKGTSNQPFIEFGSSSSYTTRGSITTNGTGTTYGTASDYRLKENIAPMIGALATVTQLKPCTYKWKLDGSDGQGFIAHELQAVVPDCVTGEKDAVKIVDDLDADGNKIGTKEVAVYQGIDTSFLVATLTAAIQELNTKVDAQATTITDLTTRLIALENK